MKHFIFGVLLGLTIGGYGVYLTLERQPLLVETRGKLTSAETFHLGHINVDHLAENELYIMKTGNDGSYHLRMWRYKKGYNRKN